LLEALLDQINHHLEQNSIIVSLGSINIIEGTVIEAKHSRNRKGRNGKNAQDPEASYNVILSGWWFFGWVMQRSHCIIKTFENESNQSLCCSIGLIILRK
jgi:hypothetical protein